jgi:hypothetical protein
MALTDRQKQIADLLDKGKTPAEIAKALKITENAVYQQRRRIRQANGEKPARTARRVGRTSAPKAARKSTRKSAATRSRRSTRRAVPKPSPELGNVLGTIKLPTPLQAIRSRRDEIKQSVKHLADAARDAERAAKAAQEAHDKALAKHTDELAQLDAAEAALTGKATAKPRRQSSRKPRQSTGTVKAPEPVTPDPESEAQVAAAQAEAATTNGSGAKLAVAPEPDPQAALDAGAEFEELAAVGAEDGFAQEDPFEG